MKEMENQFVRRPRQKDLAVKTIRDISTTQKPDNVNNFTSLDAWATTTGTIEFKSNFCTYLFG